MTSEANLWWPRLHIAERSRCLAGSSAGFHRQMPRSRVSVDSFVMEVFGRIPETKLRHDFAPAFPAGRCALWQHFAIALLDIRNGEKHWKNHVFGFCWPPGVYEQCCLEWSSSIEQLFWNYQISNPAVTRSTMSVHILPALAVMAHSAVLSSVGVLNFASFRRGSWWQSCFSREQTSWHKRRSPTGQHHRRKLDNQTSDKNWYDRWNSRGGMERVREEKKLEERGSRCANRWKRRNSLCFPVNCGSWGSKSRLAEAADAEPSFWPDEISKKCTPLWREAHVQVNMHKAHQVRRTFWSWDVEKVRLWRKSHLQVKKLETARSDHFWMFRCGLVDKSKGFWTLPLARKTWGCFGLFWARGRQICTQLSMSEGHLAELHRFCCWQVQ